MKLSDCREAMAGHTSNWARMQVAVETVVSWFLSNADSPFGDWEVTANVDDNNTVIINLTPPSIDRELAISNILPLATKLAIGKLHRSNGTWELMARTTSDSNLFIFDGTNLPGYHVYETMCPNGMPFKVIFPAE